MLFFQLKKRISWKNRASGIYVDSCGISDPGGEAEEAQSEPHGKRSVFRLRVITTNFMKTASRKKKVGGFIVLSSRRGKRKYIVF